MTKTRMICIAGATASGKTAAAVELAKLTDGEIVSADSMQVYRHMDIGSAKPTKEEMQGIPHHLIDCIEIDRHGYSVSEYRDLATKAIYDIAGRGKLPIVCGGTGLYINSLVYPLNFADADRDDALRERLRKMEEDEKGCLYAYLERIDEKTAKRLHPNDTKRIIRAIEVYEKSGKPLSEHGNDFRNENGADIEFDPVMFGITMPRELLYARIEKRVDAMMRDGLLQEVQSIMQLPCFSEELPAMQGLGYKQIISHILHNDPPTLEETIYRIKLETRHFAKRQLTWFRRDDRIKWIDATEYGGAEKTAQRMAQIIDERGKA